MKIPPLRCLFALCLGLSLGACVSVEHNAATTSASPGMIARISERLYFGRDIPSGGNVSDRDWTVFLAEVVTPRFPAGLTVWRANGQWRGASGSIVHEESFVLELLHPDDAATERAVREIAEEYKRRFSQESVLRVRDHVEVSF